MFKIIACINQRNVIGKDGRLLYHIHSDMVNFANMTKFNGVVIMGRKTFESLPGKKPLKDRINVIITSNKDYCVDSEFEDTYIVHSVRGAVELCEALFPEKEWFVIGGSAVYEQFMCVGLVDEIRLTVVKDDCDGDSFFPEHNPAEWYIYYMSSEQVSRCNDKEISFYFQVLKKLS